MSRKCVYQTLPKSVGRFHHCTVKVYKDNDTKEYVSRLYCDGKLIPADDYFTSELFDACITAYAMTAIHPMYY